MQKVIFRITTILVIGSLVLSGFGSANLALAQEAAPTPKPVPTNEEVAPTPEPVPTNENVAPTPEPVPTQDGTTETLDSSPASESTNNSEGESNNNWDDDDDEEEDDEDKSWNDNYGRETPTETLTQETNPIDTTSFENESGEKEDSGNVGDTTIQTGDADIAGTVISTVNQTVVSGSDPCSLCVGTDVNVTNSDNGSNSNNTSTISLDNTNETTINNNATVENDLDFEADSGNNEASKNVGDSVILTGDATVTATVITDANSVAFGIYQFDINEDQSGDVVLGESGSSCINCTGSTGDGGITATNSGNGEDSTNEINLDINNNNVTTITNEGEIINNIDLSANSGDNETNYNTAGDNTIETGDASVIANVINTLNTTVAGSMYTVNILGNLVGNIILPEAEAAATDCTSCACGTSSVSAVNSSNGSDSTNNITSTTTNTNDTTQINYATINNNLDLDGNTGDNEANFNTAGENMIESGDVNISASVTNIANLNYAGSPCDPPVYIVVINKIGQWLGQLIGLPVGTLVLGDDGQLYSVNSSGQLELINSSNGSGSTNNINADVTNTNNLTQTNIGTITNNINIDANTGGNEANYNTGGNSSIKTGDANIVLNVVNFLNSNFSGRKVVLTVINVLGSWVGNLVPFGFQSPAESNSGGTNNSSNSSSQSNSSSSGGESSSGNGGQTQNLTSSVKMGSGQIASGFSSFGQSSNDGESTLTHDQAEVAGLQDNLETAGSFNWRWFLLALLLPVVYLLARRVKLAMRRV
ncbi:MAG TPA: hypothetical protein VIK81_01420 [Patescibacteria group bacterium]